MDKYTSECIDGTRHLFEKICQGHYNLFFSQHYDEYEKVFSFSNERISECLGLCDFIENCRKALAVMSSGDHPFNLIASGVTDVDTFDINKLTEYFSLGIKRSAIIKYTYQEFLDLLSLFVTKEMSSEEVRQRIFDLLPYMDQRHRDYWQAIIDYNQHQLTNYHLDANIAELLFRDYGNVDAEEIKLNNNYLANKNAYDELRSKIGKANINFKPANILDLPQAFADQRYEIMMLSNIMHLFDEYFGEDWDYNTLRKFVKSLESLANSNAIIFLNYIDNFLNVTFGFEPIFMDSSIYIENLKAQDGFSVLNFSNYDGVLLKRVRKR